MPELGHILQAADKIDPKATEHLLPLVHEELRRLASVKMAGQATGQTLQATALVHEAWLKLFAGGERTWNDRRHFFAAAVLAALRPLARHNSSACCLYSSL